MAKKPIPIPVAERPSFPSLADATERALEQQAMGPGVHSAYIACPKCGNELNCVPSAIRPTAYDGIQDLQCPHCGWAGSIPTSGGY